MAEPLRIVGGLSDVQDMDMLSACRDIDTIRESFKRRLAQCQTHQEVLVLYRLARDWEAGFSHLTDCAAVKLERV